MNIFILRKKQLVSLMLLSFGVFDAVVMHGMSCIESSAYLFDEPVYLKHDRHGRLPLFVMIAHRDVTGVKDILQAAEADGLEALHDVLLVKFDGNTPLHLAAATYVGPDDSLNASIITTLVNCAAQNSNLLRCLLLAKNSRGEKVVEILFRRNYRTISRDLQDFMQQQKLVCFHRVKRERQLRLRTRDSAEEGRFDKRAKAENVMSDLSGSDIGVDDVVNEITDPFFRAIAYGDYECVRDLLGHAIQQGVSGLEGMLLRCNVEDGTNATPIHEMVCNGDIEMLRTVFSMIEQVVLFGNRWIFIEKLFSATDAWGKRPLTDCDDGAVKQFVHDEVLRLTDVDVDFSVLQVSIDGYVS